LQWRSRLFGDRGLLESFIDRRGLSKETLERFEIGWSDDDRAYTLPIRAASGSLLNVRLYRIEAQQTKIWSYGSLGMDASSIFPESVLQDNHAIIIAEGEWDAMMLNQHGFAAVTGTTGAEQWMAKWSRKFKGKDVTICYDRDDSGVAGAERTARMLTGIARSIKVSSLPLDYSKNRGLDVTDFFAKFKKTPKDFQDVLDVAEVFAAPKDGEPIEVSVRESFNPKLSGQPMAMTVSVVGKFSQQHLIPKDVVYTCRISAGKTCTGCPMADAEGKIEAEIERSDQAILKLRDVTESARNEALRMIIGAHKCGKMEVFIKSHHSQELLTCRTSLDYSIEDEGDTTQRVVVNVGEYATEANRVLRITGTTYPDPKDQTSVFQAWKSEPVESSLDAYEEDAEELRMMKIFRPRPGQTPLGKMKEIAYDLADNVTRIVGRPQLHMAMDIVWHSAIAFDFAGQPIERGWCELLVIGDARTGKSEVAHKLSRHYGFGRVVSCESASIPGLLGAVKQIGNRGWVLEWGAIPLNDRRLVALDEVGGLSTDQIGQLSSVRSSGRAEIIKAESHQTYARTRLIWLTNPRDNRVGMGAYMYGVRAIQPLIGNQEDIARFDFAMSVGSDDVSLEDINKRIKDPRPHTYSAAACHALVRWVWSRKREDIVWSTEAEDEVFASARAMGSEYVADPPLVQGQNIRMKLARISVAIAARTFSTDEKMRKIIVHPIHVQSAVIFLNHIYGLDGFGYREASMRAKLEERKAIEFMQDTKEYLYGRPGLARFLIASGGEFRAMQVQEQLNYTREEANLVIQKLSSMSMIRGMDAWTYRITPHLNTVLREIKER
jgi:5S rRNA maturation endonuclease (ribonuclease M5)